MTVLVSGAYPRSTWSGSHGFASAFSAMQNVYLPGWPCVDLSRTPGDAPRQFSVMSRIARPIVAFARHPGPKTFALELSSSACRIGPLTTRSVADPPVLVIAPCSVNADFLGRDRPPPHRLVEHDVARRVLGHVEELLDRVFGGGDHGEAVGPAALEVRLDRLGPSGHCVLCRSKPGHGSTACARSPRRRRRGSAR